MSAIKIIKKSSMVKKSYNTCHKGHLCPIKSYSKFTPPKGPEGLAKEARMR